MEVVLFAWQPVSGMLGSFGTEANGIIFKGLKGLHPARFSYEHRKEVYPCFFLAKIMVVVAEEPVKVPKRKPKNVLVFVLASCPFQLLVPSRDSIFEDAC